MIYSILSTLALLVISVILFFRAVELGWAPGWFWHIRRIGFILGGFAPVGIIISDFTGSQPVDVYQMLFRVGIAFVFCTTPHMPPVHTWLMGRAKSDEVAIYNEYHRRSVS